MATRSSKDEIGICGDTYAVRVWRAGDGNETAKQYVNTLVTSHYCRECVIEGAAVAGRFVG